MNGEHTWRDEKIKLNLEAGAHRLRVYYLDELFDDQVVVADRNVEFIYMRYQPEPGGNWFSDVKSFRFEFPEEADTIIVIYNLLGR